MKPMVWIHADESCLGNQFSDRNSPGGAGGLVEFWTGEGWVRRDLWFSEPSTTNNRMAIRGATELLERLSEPCRVIFVSDSQYLVKGMREWIAGWIRKGWKRRSGPVENVELWKRLVAAAGRHLVDWRWVRGHAGDPRNEYADRLAVGAAKELSESDGLVPSGFGEWLEEEREKGRYLDVFEFQPPEESGFSPVPAPGAPRG